MKLEVLTTTYTSTRRQGHPAIRWFSGSSTLGIDSPILGGNRLS